MKSKKLLNLVLAFIMLFSALPQISFAADESINVTVKFDASVVAEDTDRLYSDLLSACIIDEKTSNIPSDIALTVPRGTSVREILKAAQNEAGFTAVGIDENYVTQIGYVGSDLLANLVSIPIGDYYSGNVFNSAGWSFYINGEGLSSGIDAAAVTEEGAVIEGVYGLATGWDPNWNAVHYDEIFLENYSKLKELTEKDVDTGSFSEKQKQKLASEKAEAEELLTEIYNEAALNDEISALLLELHPEFKTTGGMWIGYFEKKGISFWGNGSPSEALETAVEELAAAMDPLPENMLSGIYVTTLFGTAEDNLVLDFASDKHEYVIKDYTRDNFLPKFMKWKSVAVSEDAAVSVTLNGEAVSPSELSEGWKQYSALDWESNICNTLVFTVTPPEESGLAETAYTVKIYPELTDAQKVSLAKDLLTWDIIKGMNQKPAEITSSLYLPPKIEIPDIGEVSVTWSGPDGEFLDERGTLLSRPQSNTAITLIAALVSGEADDTASFELTLLPETEKESRDARIAALLKSIAGAYIEKSSAWEAMDMGAYKKYAPETEFTLSGDAVQSLINESVKTVSGSTKDTELAKAILALTAQGKDATRLYTVNSNDPINAVDKLNNTEHSTSVWSAPYTLAVYNRSEYKNRQKELSLVNALLTSQRDDGAWDEYGTIDTTANAIAGLAFYLDDTDPAVKDRVNKAIESALSYLSAQQNQDGTFSDSWAGRNSNSTAMVAIALAAAGVDPENDERFIKCGNSIADGLLFFALEDNSAFGYTDNITAAAYSTEQAFRTLTALAGAIRSNAAYNVYDLNGISLSPTRATGSSAVGGIPSQPQGDNITVSLSIKADSTYWLNSCKVTLPGEGATVYHAFIKACSANRITYTGADDGYVSSISKGSQTLSEFGAGKNSGWLYTLNGEAPLLGIRECAIKSGDKIEFFYTKDYTKEPISGGWRGSDTQKEQPKEAEKEEDSGSSRTVFADVAETDWYYDSVKYVYENSIMNGTANGFEPNGKMSRAMLVTVLYRMADPVKGEFTHSFSDTAQGMWYSDAVAWAAERGIVNGISSTKFSPDTDISREQMALILYRFVKELGCDVSESADISNFEDADDVSIWALDAVKWANEKGLMRGTSDTALSPKAAVTRAQAAEILMRFCKNTTK